MPEQITQHLGFDASRAIQELGRLRGELNNFKQSLQSVSGALRKFPSNATPAIQAFKQLATSATAARTAIQGVAGAGAAPTKLGSSAQQAATSMNNLATQAQSASQKASTAVTGSFNQASQAIQQTGQSAKQSGAAVQAGAAQTSAAASKTASAMKNAGQAGKQAASDITLSWKTVIRVVQAQVIVRAISAIVSAFKEANVLAAEFSSSLAEAFVISDGQLGTMQQMEQSVLALGRSLSLTSEEVVEGVYQTLSNQVVEAGEALEFTSQAAKLSIATHSELNEAVNALSSVMNSYSLDVSETSRVSDILFKTVELGRLRLSEFGDVLGRVSPLTAALGIRYEEMAAAIAALTRKGIPAHTAITQLTQVSQKLLRPTGALEALYKQWGVETGPEAIRRFGGLQGVLLKMSQATAGNDVEFANLLGRVRAIVGALNLADNEGSELAKTLREMEEAVGATNRAFEQVEDSVGRKAIKAWGNLKTTLTELGLTFLKVTTPMIKGVDALLSSMDNLAIVAGTAAGAWVLYKGSAVAAAVATMGLQGALLALRGVIATYGPLLIAFAAAWAAVEVGKFIRDTLDKATEATERIKANEAALTKAQRDYSQQRIEATRKEFEERRKITGQFFSEATKQYQRDFDLLEASSEAVGTTLENTLDDLLSKRKDAIKALKDAVLEADSAIKDSMEVVRETQASIAEDAFEREKRHMTARQQLWAEIERAQRTAADARRAYAEAGADESKNQAARELSYLAEKRAEEAVSHAEEMGNYGDLKRAEDELDRIRADRIRGEITFQQRRKSLQTEAHKERISQLEEEGERLELLLEKVRELMDPLADGELKGPKQMREDFERVLAMMPEINAQLESAFDFSMFERLGIEESMQQLKQGVKDALVDAKINWDAVLNDFQSKLSARSFEAPVTLKIENEYIIEEFVKRFGEIDPLGDPGKIGSQMEQVLEDTVMRYEEFQRTIDQNNEMALRKVENALSRLTPDEWFTGWDRFKETLNEGMADVADAHSASAGVLTDYGAAVRAQVPPTEELRQRLVAAGEALQQTIQQKKPLTEAQRESILATLEYAKELERAGELSTNMQNQGVPAFKAMQEATDLLARSLEAANEQAKIGPEAYEASLKGLDDIRQKAQESTQAQEGITTEAGETGQQLQDAKQAQIDLPVAAEQSRQALAQETEQARQLRIELEGAKSAQEALSQSQAQTPGAPGEPAAPERRELTMEELQQLIEASRQLSTELGGVDQKFNQIVASTTALTEAFAAPTEAVVAMQNSLAAAQQSAQGISTAMPMITEQINTANASVINLITSLNNAATATTGAAQAAANWNQQLQGCAQSGYAAASAMQAAAQAAIQAAQACAQAAAACSGGSVGAAHGGRYFASGGRGTDVIPAWLTPGEFVVNARAARNFFPQLQAINAGQPPVYRNEGGPVTNIGDINVTVQGGESSSQTVREIATGLRRELRRKTVRLY